MAGQEGRLLHDTKEPIEASEERGMSEAAERLRFHLPDALPRHLKYRRDLLECFPRRPIQPKPQLQHLSLALRKRVSHHRPELQEPDMLHAKRIGHVAEERLKGRH